MTRAGAAKVVLPVAAGMDLMGYPDRAGPATGVHDALHVRALVLAAPDPVALVSVELCWVGEDLVAAARERIARDTGIPPDRVFVSATHTHSGPHDQVVELDAAIAAAVAEAAAALRPARVGAGFGMVHGVALNRRRLEDPVDPALLALRVDGEDGRPLALYVGFGCHAVVLGPDNRLASGDWPGACARALEEQLGAVVLVAQGSCADVNPLTAGVEARSGPYVSTNGTPYYGPPAAQSIGDRSGGTFAEAEALGARVAEEALRVHGGIAPVPLSGIATRRLAVPAEGDGADIDRSAWAPPRTPASVPLEVMTVALEGAGVLLAGQPGEVFAATGSALRTRLRHAGHAHPFVVGYANGWRAYLPPAAAYPDGGYEVDWARFMRLAPDAQDDIAAALIG